MITPSHSNLAFLGFTSVTFRTCSCGQVRAIHQRAAKAAMGGCDPFDRVACSTCHCLVDARGQEKRDRIAKAVSRQQDDSCCLVCGAPAVTVGTDDDPESETPKIPLCDACLEEAESVDEDFPPTKVG